MACSKCQQSRYGCGGQGCANAGPLPANAPPGAWVPPGAPPGAWTHVSPDGVVSCGWPVPSTGGILSSLTVTAADTGAKRLAKEFGMFALLTSPAWILLLLLPKPAR